MKFKLIPLEGTDSIKLGMDSSDLQQITGMHYKKLKKTKWDFYESEMFHDFKVEYDDSGKCISLEFYEPCNVFFENHQLIGMNYIDLEKVFKQLDPDLVYEEGCGLYSLKYQIGIYCSGEPLRVETVSIGIKDYYPPDFLKTI